MYSVTDRKPFIACGFCGVKISPVIGYNTKNIPDISQTDHAFISSAVNGRNGRIITQIKSISYKLDDAFKALWICEL